MEVATLRTIIDDDGRAWQGVEVDDGPSVNERGLVAIATGGFSELFRMISPKDERITVEVNGHRHRGDPED